MNIIAKRAVEVSGYGIVRRGQVIDYPETAINERIACNFVGSDGTALTVGDEAEKTADADGAPAGQTDEDSLVKRTVDTLGRDGILRKLDEMGISYKPTHRTDYLAKLYLQAKGEL